MSTNAKPFFDTNVLVYVLGEREGRTARAEELLAAGGVVSVQVLNELVNVARRTLGLSWAEVGDALEAVPVFCPEVVDITVALHEAALRIAGRYGHGIDDAQIVAAAIEAGCPTLYSEGLQDGQLIERRLTVRNPFPG